MLVNSAVHSGGGLDNRGGNVSVNNSVLSDNSTSDPQGTGGAVNNVYDSDIVASLWMTDSTITGNRAGQNGGGILSNGVARLLRVTLDHNRPRQAGAASTTRACSI